MILCDKVIAVTNEDDFEYLEKSGCMGIKGCRPDYVLCPENRKDEFIQSRFFKIIIFPMLNIKDNKINIIFYRDIRGFE